MNEEPLSPDQTLWLENAKLHGFVEVRPGYKTILELTPEEVAKYDLMSDSDRASFLIQKAGLAT